MKYFWSEKNQGFYLDEVHGDSMPSDAVEVTESDWRNGKPAQFEEYTEDELKGDFERAVQAELVSGCNSWGYDSPDSLPKYFFSKVEKFKLESLALADWVAECWVWAGGLSLPSSLPSRNESGDAIKAALSGMPALPERPVVSEVKSGSA